MRETEATIFQQHAELFRPHDEEWEVLKQFDPEILFRAIEPYGMSTGKQARVSVLEYQGGQETTEGETENLPRYVVWKRMGEGRGLTLEEATAFHEHLDPYVASLRERDWNVPAQLYRQIVPRESETQLFSYEQLVPGGDGEHLLRNPAEPKFRKWFFIRSTLERLASYDRRLLKPATIGGRDLTLLPEGVDLKPANLILDRNEKLWLVDVFGPKAFDRTGNFLTYSEKLEDLPPENLKKVCATREGLILRFMRLAERAWTANDPSETAEQLHRGFRETIRSNDLPKRERDFIEAELESNYPWLDSVYTENQV